MKTKTTELLILILIVLISTLTANAQKGVPFITNFELPDNMSNQNWAMAQSDNHLMYILNRKGVYHFDGFEWEKLNIKGKPLAIYFQNDLFVSTDEGLGFVRRDARGDYNYFAIQDTSSNVYFKFFAMDNSLYVAGVQGVSRVNFSDVVVLEPIYVDRDTMQYINDCFQHNGLVYIIKSKTNIFRVDDQKLLPVRFDLQKNETISFTFNHGKQVFVGTSANKLYRFNGLDFKQVTLKDQKYIDASYLNGGISVDSGRFALSTLIGGCVIVNANTYETETTLNFANGLPDDEILSMGKDKNGGLWLAHGMGISRIDLRIPVKSYENYQGLRGNILSVAEYNKTIYAGSSEGLFYLTEIKDYKEIEVPVKKVEPIKAAEVVKELEPQPAQEQPPTQTEQEETKKKKKGFFARLFDKTAREEHRQAKAEEEALTKKKEELAAAMPKTPEPRKEISAEKKKIYALQSVSHAYQKVAGIDGKCKQLLIFNGKLLVVSSTGIYLVEDGQGRAVLAGTYILFAKPSEYNKNSIYLCTNQGVIKLTAIADRWQANAVLSLENELPVSLVEIAEDKLMITTEFNVYKVSIVQGGQAETANLSPSGYSIDSPVARKISGITTIFTSEYLFKYLPERDSLVIDNTVRTKNFIKTIYSQPQYTWVSINKRWALEGADSVPNLPAARFLNLFDRINDIFVNDRHEIFIVNNYTKIVKISAKEKDLALAEFDLFLKQVTDNEGTKLNPSDVTLSYANNALNIKISAPFFVKQKAVEFQYMVEGMMTEWTDWKTDPVQNFPYFPNGKYKLLMRARDIFGNQSPVYTLAFEIKPPFWKQLWFIILASVVVLTLFALLVKYRERQLQREKQILEEKVRERTRTIEEQKEVLAAQRDELAKTNQEILQQKEEIEAQRDEIETQRDHIAKQNDEITKSIEYAYRIQTAVMPTKEEIDTLLPDYFILFKPRDIVSGDFYWVAEKNGKIVVVAADCTGHGVPGAFMSMLGVSFLNEIVKGSSITQPNMIINHLRDMVKTTLSQTGKEGESKDGMDIAICTIDLSHNRLEYAGAYNPLYLIHNGELIEYKADKMPVGIHLNERDTFTNNEIDFQPGDTIYIFSDGYVSQFGGDDGRKFMAKPFKKLLTDISMKPMSDQRERLNARLEEWQGYHPQVDDILVIGVKF